MTRKKGIFTKSELESLLRKKNSCVSLKKSVIDVYLMPYYLNDVVSGLWNALHKKLKAYDSKIEGILLGYTNIKVDLDLGRFSGRNAEIKYPVSCDSYVFQPSVGDRLQGKVNQMSSDHIGCIVHQYFNATIVRPSDEPYEDWNNRCIDYDQMITFRVKDLDYTGFIPYIEGELDTYTTKTSKGHRNFNTEDNNDFQEIKSRSDVSLISSTQLPSDRKYSFSDSGLEFDVLSPIPQLKEVSKKKQNSFKEDIDEDDSIQKQPLHPSSKSLKRKYDISPDERSPKKIKMSSDTDAGSSTKVSANEKRKKKKSLFDFIAIDKNTSKGMNDSKTKHSPKNSKDKYETVVNLTQYSDAIESVIKQTKSASLSDYSNNSVLKQNSAENNETVKIASKVKENKSKVRTTDNVKGNKIGSSLVENKKETSLSPYSDAIESAIKKNTSAASDTIDSIFKKISAKQNKGSESIQIDKNAKKPKENKTKEKGSAIKHKLSSDGGDNTKNNKIKSNVKAILKKDTEISLSPYSDAIESVIGKTVSQFDNKTSENTNLHISEAISSVIEQIRSGSKEFSTSKKKTMSNLDDMNSVVEESSDEETTIEKKKKKGITAESPVSKNTALHISEAIDSVIEQIKSDSEEYSTSNKKKKKNSTVNVLPSISEDNSNSVTKLSKKKINKDQSVPEVIEAPKSVTSIKKLKQKKNEEKRTEIKQKSIVGYLTPDNAKEHKIKKSKVKTDAKIENEKEPLSPYSDAIESVIKQNNYEISEESPSTSKKKKKKIDQTKIIPKEQNNESLDSHVLEAIETVLKQNNPEVENPLSAKKKIPKKPQLEVLKISGKSRPKTGDNNLNLGQNSEISDTPKISKKVKKSKAEEDPESKLLTEYFNKMKEIAAKGGKKDLLLSMIKNLK